jgi:ABC-type spermidine/putrescine transport system permease subunit I
VPLGLFYLVFFLIPEIYFLRLAFYRSDDLGQLRGGITMGTVTGVLTSSYYLGAIWRTVELCLLTTAFTLLFAYPIAYVIVGSRRRGRVLFIFVVAAMYSNAVARVLGWKVLLAATGPVNRLLVDTGLADQPVQLTNNFVGVTIGTVHAMLPIAVIGLMPVCEMVPAAHLEASVGLGASRWRSFWSVFFPQTRTGVVSVGLLVFAVTAGTFTTPALLGGGRVGVLGVLIYTTARQTLDYATAAVLSLVLFVLVFVTVLLGLALNRRTRRHTARPATTAGTVTATAGSAPAGTVHPEQS